MKKLMTFLTITAAMLCMALTAQANTYLNGFEGSYFNSIPDDPRTWFGDSLVIHEITDTEISFDYEYEKPGHAVAYTEEKAVFTDPYTAVANGSVGYADMDERSPITYNFRFTDNHIILRIDDANGLGEEKDFYAENGRIIEPAGIKVFVNGAEIAFEQEPVIIEERTMVPMRAIIEALGANVGWDGSSKTVTASKDGINISLQIGNSQLYKNTEAITIDAPARIINDVTLVPARAIAEAFDCNVDWDETNRSVIITSDGGDAGVISYDRATQLIAETYDEIYRSDFKFNLTSEDDNFYYIGLFWHNEVTGNYNNWGDYAVDKKSGEVTAI